MQTTNLYLKEPNTVCLVDPITRAGYLIKLEGMDYEPAFDAFFPVSPQRIATLAPMRLRVEDLELTNLTHLANHIFGQDLFEALSKLRHGEVHWMLRLTEDEYNMRSPRIASVLTYEELHKLVSGAWNIADKRDLIVGKFAKRTLRK